MRITVLIDNETRSALRSEWGLSFHIAYGGRTDLLDAGASGAFAENADALGLDLAAVDDAVLSHAHNDHADGLDGFFVRNAAAPCWLRAGCAEDCYDRTDEGWSYAGPRPGLLAQWADRLRYVDGDVSLAPGVWLVPHKTPGLARIGERGRMFRKRPSPVGRSVRSSAASTSSRRPPTRSAPSPSGCGTPASGRSSPGTARGRRPMRSWARSWGTGSPRCIPDGCWTCDESKMGTKKRLPLGSRFLCRHAVWFSPPRCGPSRPRRGS